MGAIGGDELMKWENMEGMSNGNEEKILVLVRLRPLSEKEVARNEVSDWECINDTTILFRNSLQERSMFPTAYTFDRVFGGDCPTRQVYDEGAKDIALSVVSGVNSTIFAYGQTSSGKTYTMIGITEYTVADIYDYMRKHEERAFVLKFSAIEIYNEAIRDLLSTDNLPLRLLDDPEKGTVVENLTEITLRDLSHLKGLLSICEAQRKVGETSLNETSSRSHQILRLTIESSAREFLGKDKSTKLAASVSFVDLAGSERASQALSVGQRLKEGCHINRSLLTLSTVIRKLSKGRHGHVNYRDSKLTRILQPCLGGNARTAIICTLSPARDHVEQSRNTLLFASCAKEVSTNAKVNVVMSDKALVKHLQKELARLESELRTPGPTSTCDHAPLLRKKDLQIEKLEKEVKELTKQRDLAESRVKELLQAAGNDQTSVEPKGLVHQFKFEEGSSCVDEHSASESSGVANSGHLSKTTQLEESDEDSHMSENTNQFDHSNEFALRTGESSQDDCREVRCIENDGDRVDNLSESVDTNSERLPRSIVADQEVLSRPRNAYGFGVLEQRFQDVQRTINSLVIPNANEPPQMSSSSVSLQLTRSRSCRPSLMDNNSLSTEFQMAEHSERTPPDEFERNFPGRPERLQRKMWNLPLSIFGASNSPRLTRNDSQSSLGSAMVDEVNTPKNKESEDDEIPSVDNFVAGMKKMAKLQYENQLFDDQVQGVEGQGTNSGRNVKDAASGPMTDSIGTPSSWPMEFARLQKCILELWEACNVSLIHRTYFFLLFRGDPMDSIYMEVEFRRLTFLKETFSNGTPALEDGRTLTLTSSVKALHRERAMLSRLMFKRLSEEERNKIYQRWGISLSSKRRRLQLINQLWRDADNRAHIEESASIVAKLIRFSEQSHAPKEMFGLSFSAQRISRRSFGWRRRLTT